MRNWSKRILTPLFAVLPLAIGSADAQKLTQKNPDGSLKVVGFDPASGFYDGAPNKVLRFASLFGGHYTDAKGHSILSKDPAWTSLLRFGIHAQPTVLVFGSYT